MRAERGSIAVKARHPRTRHHRDPAFGADPVDAVVKIIGDKQVAGLVHRHVAWSEKLDAQRISAFARRTRGSTAGHRSHLPVGSDPPHAPIAKVSHEEIAARVQRQSVRGAEDRLGRRAAVAAESCAAIAGDR